MTGFKKALAVFEAKKVHKKVELRNGITYNIKGVGATALQLGSLLLLSFVRYFITLLMYMAFDK